MSQPVTALGKFSISRIVYQLIYLLLILVFSANDVFFSSSLRQLATAAAGVPLFEIFLTVNKKGEYRQQVFSTFSLVLL